MDPGNAHQYLPLSRNPWAYVSPGSSYTPVKPMDLAQGRRGIAEAEHMLIRPSTAPAAYPRKVTAYTKQMPFGTALGPDRLYDDGIKFPRGDLGAQMFPKEKPKRDGDKWAAAPRSTYVKEVGTKPHNCLRAFKSKQCGNVLIYQAAPPKPRATSMKLEGFDSQSWIA